MTTLAERVTVEARPVEIRKALLTVVAAVLYAIGWLAAGIVLAAVNAVRWSVAAVRLGWSDGREQWAARAKRRAATR